MSSIALPINKITIYSQSGSDYYVQLVYQDNSTHDYSLSLSNVQYWIKNSQQIVDLTGQFNTSTVQQIVQPVTENTTSSSIALPINKITIYSQSGSDYYVQLVYQDNSTHDYSLSLSNVQYWIKNSQQIVDLTGQFSTSTSTTPNPIVNTPSIAPPNYQVTFYTMGSSGNYETVVLTKSDYTLLWSKYFQFITSSVLTNLPVTATYQQAASFIQPQNTIITQNGTVESGTLNGQAITNPVKFDIISNNGSLSNVILSATDYQLLQANSAPFTITNISTSSSYVPNMTYSQLVNQLNISGSTGASIPSNTAPGTTSPAPTGSTTNINTQASPSPGTTTTPVQQTISINGQAMPVLTPTGSPAVYTVVTKNADGTVNLLTNYGGVTQTFHYITIPEVQQLENSGATVNDPNGLLTAPTPAPGNVTVPGNLNQNPSTPTGQQTIPTDPITQQNLNTIIEQSAIQNPLSTGGQTFNKNSLSINPLGVITAGFIGLLGLAIAVPSGLITKQLKRKRGNKK